MLPIGCAYLLYFQNPPRCLNLTRNFLSISVTIGRLSCIVLGAGVPGGRLLGQLFLVASAICLSGCAAREVTPVRMTQAGDENLDCPALKQQIQANRADAEDFVRKDKQVENQNTAKIVAGSVIPFVGILLASSTDLSNEEQIKGRALVDRDEQLTFLAKQKGCEIPQ